MDINKILSADILDILFDGRNKEYGAYELRKTYSKRITYSLVGTFVICLLMLVGSIIANSAGKKKAEIVVQDMNLENMKTEEKKPEPPPPPPPPKQEPPKVEITKFTPPKIVKDEEVKPDEEIKEVEKLEDTKIGTINQEGLPAWTKYLERNLNRDLPVENGAPPGKYTVIVSFIVSKTGAISDVTAENDPGYGTKAEAIRVITKGPSWKPAVQNGRNVIYRHKQSITFQVSDE